MQVNTKMKIMWLCNSPIPQVAKACNISETIHAGWLVNVATELEKKENIDFSFVMLTNETTEEIHYVENKRSTYVMVNLKDQSEEALIRTFEKIIKKINPDVIHIWGTEYKHSWAMTQAAMNESVLNKVVVSMQGLVSMISRHYMGGIPGIVQVLPTLRDLLRKDTLKMQEMRMKQRGVYERKTLAAVEHVIGRTFWDHACAKLVNPQVKYHFNNETLREPFYTSQWEYEKCKKHSLFVSQTEYPIKGFHYLLEAMAILKEKYPDISVYMGGHDNAMKTGILVTAYGKYLQALIKRYGLEGHVHYMGKLNAEEMKKHFLQAEVFVSPSVIENSPNSVGEAMLLGVPVVASNVGGVADMLVHEKEGYLYQADAPYLLAYYIGQLFDNQEKECEFGSNARMHAQKTHDKKENMRALLEVYNDIAKERLNINDI